MEKPKGRQKKGREGATNTRAPRYTMLTAQARDITLSGSDYIRRRKEKQEAESMVKRRFLPLLFPKNKGKSKKTKRIKGELQR